MQTRCRAACQRGLQAGRAAPAWLTGRGSRRVCRGSPKANTHGLPAKHAGQAAHVMMACPATNLAAEQQAQRHLQQGGHPPSPLGTCCRHASAHSSMLAFVLPMPQPTAGMAGQRGGGMARGPGAATERCSIAPGGLCSPCWRCTRSMLLRSDMLCAPLQSVRSTPPARASPTPHALCNCASTRLPGHRSLPRALSRCPGHPAWAYSPATTCWWARPPGRAAPRGRTRPRRVSHRRATQGSFAPRPCPCPLPAAAALMPASAAALS